MAPSCLKIATSETLWSHCNPPGQRNQRPGEKKEVDFLRRPVGAEGAMGHGTPRCWQFLYLNQGGQTMPTTLYTAPSPYGPAK